MPGLLFARPLAAHVAALANAHRATDTAPTAGRQGGTGSTGANAPDEHAPMSSMLRFDNVSKQYRGGHVALSDVSFEVQRGEMLFVTGHSGAGKSTLLKLIHLGERPSRGAVLFGERNLLKVRGRRVPLHRRDVGVVFQDHRLLADRTVFENVALPLILRGMRRGEIAKRVRSVLDRLGLGGRERALPTQLSAGEQQRVGIARALVGEPQLLVADEPTGNLDPALSAEIMTLFAALPERGTSVLIASHDLGLVRRLKKRVLVLDQGRLADDIAPEDLADA
jgi:cell division transport system ATP-binding protein